MNMLSDTRIIHVIAVINHTEDEDNAIMYTLLGILVLAIACVAHVATKKETNG